MGFRELDTSNKLPLHWSHWYLSTNLLHHSISQNFLGMQLLTTCVTIYICWLLFPKTAEMQTTDNKCSYTKTKQFCRHRLSYIGYILHLTHTHTHTRLTALFPGLPRWAGTRKVKPIWILLKQETVSGSGISWAICKSAPRSRQITIPAPHHSVFYRSDALPAAQSTALKHWRQILHFTSHMVL